MTMTHTAFTPWERAIILVDMNAFFASIEQLDKPEWRGRPVAITN
jgi:DNA polymerase-4